jgi:predicted RNA binding protein YcfA (HicA-like mRNA interferase family)
LALTLPIGYKISKRDEDYFAMARKIRQLIKDLTDAGFYEIRGGGKGSQRKFTHARYAGAVTLSGKSGEDAKPYQERQVQRAVEEVLK